MSEQRRAASQQPPTAESRAQQLRRVRVDVARARAFANGADLATTQPWAAEKIARDVAAISQQRFFPGNEPGGNLLLSSSSSVSHAGGAPAMMADNSAHSIVRAVPASNLIRETMAAPTIDAWPRKQNKLSSLSQKPSDAENVPPLMRQLNKLVWEGTRSVGVIVERCVAEYKRHGAEAATARGRKQLMHDVTEIFDPAAISGGGKEGDKAFSQLSAARLTTEVVHRFLDKTLVAEQRAAADPDELQQNRDELARENRHAEQVAMQLGAAVARWSIFEQAGAVFSKCFATYEAAISEVMKECADCVDDVLNVLVTEVVALRGRVAEGRAQHRKHEHQMSQIRRERDESNKAAHDATEAARDALQRIAAADKENRRLAYELEDSEKTIQRQREESDILSKQYNVQENRIAKLAKQLSAAREQIDALATQVADLKRNLAQSESVASTCAVETLQLRQQLTSVNTAFLQLRHEGKVAAGEPKPEFVFGRRSVASLFGEATKKLVAANNNNSNSSAANPQSTPVAAAAATVASVKLLDMNEWFEAACRSYVAEADARMSLEYFGVEDERYHAAGAFVNWRAALNAGLQQQGAAALLQDNSSNSGVFPSYVSAASAIVAATQIHFPELKARNSTSLQIVSVADEAARPFFVGMGESPLVPSALRYVGKIRNMRFGVETVSNMIIAFFRDTAENSLKNVLVNMLDPVHQYGVVGYGSLTHEEYNTHVRRTLTDDQRSLAPPPAPLPSTQTQAVGGAKRKNDAHSDEGVSVAGEGNADRKTLIQLLSHWLSIHLDCNDDSTPTLYNMLYAARWHSYAPVCRFFDAAARFDAPALLWLAITETIELFKRQLEACVQDVFSVAEASVQEAVKKTFSSSLSDAAVTRISVVVHQFFHDQHAAAEQHAQSAATSSPNQQQPSPLRLAHAAPEITLRSIFVSGIEFPKRKHRRLVIARTTMETTTCAAIWAADSVDESGIVASIRNECILAWFDLMAEMTESIMDRAIVSPEGHVTPYSLVSALLHVDPLRPRTSMDKIVKTIFGAEKERPSQLSASSASNGASASAASLQPNAADAPFSSSAFLDGSGDAVRHCSKSSVAGAAAASLLDNDDVLSLYSKSESSARFLGDDGGAALATDKRSSGKKKTEDDEEERGVNYAERYRSRAYVGGDMMLVNEALARLKMIALARYTPTSDNGPVTNQE